MFSLATFLTIGVIGLLACTVARVLEDHPLIQAAANWLIKRDVL